MAIGVLYSDFLSVGDYEIVRKYAEVRVIVKIALRVHVLINFSYPVAHWWQWLLQLQFHFLVCTLGSVVHYPLATVYIKCNRVWSHLPI